LLIGKLAKLVKLALDFAFASITNVSEVGAAVGKLLALETLSLNFARCTELRDLKGLDGIGKGCPALRDIFIDITETEVADLSAVASLMSGGLKSLEIRCDNTPVKDLGPFGKALGKMQPTLARLVLSCNGTKVKDMGPLGKALGKQQFLSHLDLSLCSTGVKDVGALVKSLGKLHALRRLELSLSDTLVKDVSGIAKPISRIGGLEHLELKLAATKVGDLDVHAIGYALAQPPLRGLRYLGLGFSDTRVGDIRALGAVGLLPGLSYLDIGLNGTQVSDVTPLVALAQAGNLAHVGLFLSETRITDVEYLGVALARLPLLSHVELNFAGCAQLVNLGPVFLLPGLRRLDVRGCEALSDDARTGVYQGHQVPGIEEKVLR
jgi:hypothetical protein